jgi:hypothetical protein
VRALASAPNSVKRVPSRTAMTNWPSSRHANQRRPLSPSATAPAERRSGAMLMLVDEMSGRGPWSKRTVE